MSKSKMDMKSMMAWVKSRWSLVAFVVVALLLVPAMVYFAMGMTAAKHEAFQKTVKEDAALYTSPNIKYTLPPMLASEPATETTHAPNEELNKKYGAALTLQQESAGGLVAEAVKINKGDGDHLHKQLIDAPPMFPDKAGDVLLAKQFRRIYVKDAMTALLASINAKDPLSATQLAQVLRDKESNFLTRELGTDAKDGRARLPEDKAKALDKEMVDLRVDQYRLWGQKLSVYAGMGIFTLPAVVEADTPTPTQLWDWQVQYWTMQDILRGVADANMPARDRGVTKSVVKRIEHLTVDPDTATTPNLSGGMDPNAPPPVAGAAAAGDSGLDYSRSITGHKSGPLYDVRTATLVCVLSTENMPAFFDTLSQSNLMTVTSVKLTKVDLLADLKDGYFYGSEGVTRAEITIEAIWLRDWTKDLMPKEVRVALGLEAGDPGAAPAGGAPNGAPTPPPPSGRRAGGAAGG